ncbi:hypothetical protein Sjap_000382 [Stephania japonica]|uniref:Integrase catalytic domain-containing protein n=1 Tax=Stephania japonica TaxID=461633 RepID=A0AAP0PQP3_9MAGN
MCTDFSLLQNPSIPSKPMHVFLPDGSMKFFDHVGHVQLSSKLLLHSCLHLASFKHNLLSVSKLTSTSKVKFSFLKQFCVLQDLENSQVLTVGRALASLYVFDSSSFSPEVFRAFTKYYDSSLRHFTSCNAVNSVLSWHQRLGHPSLFVAKHLHTLIPGFVLQSDVTPVILQNSVVFLYLLVLLKLLVFQLLHMDVWGPYEQQSLQGSQYFLTIVDNFSRFTRTYLLSCKSSTVNTIDSFLRFVHNLFNTSVQIVRTDNGSEFVNIECTKLFSQMGIFHQRSTPYTSQQNGVVERKHRHSLQVLCSNLVYQNFFGGMLSYNHLPL